MSQNKNENKNSECPHCKFIDELAKYLIDCGDSTNREYWILTEIFTHTHNGKDYCDYEKV